MSEAAITLKSNGNGLMEVLMNAAYEIKMRLFLQIYLVIREKNIMKRLINDY